MNNGREDNGAGTITIPRARDRASQIDFLRELSRSRRIVSRPTGPAPVADDSTDVVASRSGGPTDGSDEAAWTMTFVPADSPMVGLFDILPVATWPDPTLPDSATSDSATFDTFDTFDTSDTSDSNVSNSNVSDTADWSATDLDHAGESSRTEEWGDESSDAAGGLFDLLPATTWPEVSEGTGWPDSSPDIDKALSAGGWSFDRSEQAADTSSVVDPTVTGTFAGTSPVTADFSAPGPVALGENRPTSAPTEVPLVRPPTITDETPVAAQCRGLVASQFARGRRRTVLTGVDLTVRSGEVAVITGRSGSGKTTLLECLAGLHRVDAGTITIGDTVLGDATEEQIADLRATTIGYVSQEPQLLADLSVIENIELPLLLSGWDPSEARTEAEAAVALVGLRQPTFRASELSCGERRRVAIARALVGEPSILWLDEASAAIDPETMAEIYELIFELCHDGLTVVAVTHDPLMLACATSTYELRDGSLHPVGA